MELESKDSPMPASIRRAILQSPVPYGDEGTAEDVKQCEKLVDGLSEKELEEAAQASYAYWLECVVGEVSPDQRRHMAMKEMRRHLFKLGAEKAKTAFLNTMQYRKDIRVDLLRACFLPGLSVTNSDDLKKLEHYRTIIMEDLTNRHSCSVRGVDKQGHSLLIVHPRNKAPVSDEAFIVSQMYLMERAIACTEYISQGQHEKITVVIDFGGSSSSYSPSWKALHQAVLNLQYCYPERLKRLVICDAPFFIRTTYKLLTPFMHSETRDKFVMVSGNEQKVDALSELVAVEQAMPFMLPGGKLTSAVKVEKFIKQVPFHCLYDNAETEEKQLQQLLKPHNGSTAAVSNGS